MSNETMIVSGPDLQNYRLPRSVIPQRYEITLEPDLQKFSFQGRETIDIQVHEAVSEIVLNALELEIAEVSVVSPSGGAPIIGKASPDPVNERVRLTFPQPISAGLWKLSLRFSGVLNDKLKGFYRSSYKDAAGQEKMLATTQFEATDARKAFPCWDEPDYKTSFRVTLVVDEGLTAISNASVVSETPAGKGKKAVTFADTIKMSTYLVAFLVGEFEGTDPVDAGGTPIRIWSVPGKARLGKFAEKAAVHSLNFFSQYYGIPYPGDKLDLIAIPDFASGAMENLGAVTFRENALLVDEQTASHAELERVADVVAHELAHMWFGDLVTMKWWNGLWLNEAFATFMEMLAVDAWKPQWKRWETFGVSRATAFGVDSLKSTRPIEYPVRHPDEAGQMFDVLTYEKGASVLRMLEQYLGGESFRKGISLYLHKHQFGNAETTDLWDALEESSNQPVRKTMDTWIFQGGYPLISVEANSDSTGVVLSQRRFLYLSEGEKNEQLFKVPLMLRAKTDAGMVSKRLILTEPKHAVDLGGKIDWVVVNEGGHGFYRTGYAGDLLERLTAVIFRELSGPERFNLISDTWASTIAGQIPLSDYLKTARVYEQETDKNVWALIIGSMHYLNRVIDNASRPMLEGFVRRLVTSTGERLGWSPKSGEDELTGQLRAMIWTALGTLGNDGAVQSKAKEVYTEYKQDGKSVDPNLVPALVSILAYCGDEARYEEFLQQFKSAKTPQEEQRYLFSLAAFQKPELLRRTLEKTVNGEVRTQNAPYLVQALLSNVISREDAWYFMKGNWDTMVRLFPENAVPRMCEGVTSLVSKKLEEDVRQFFADQKVKQGEKAIAQHLEKLRIAILLKQRESKTLASLLSSIQ